MRRRWTTLAGLGLAYALAGCGTRTALSIDVDAARPDAGRALRDGGFDAGPPDAGRTDAGRPDAGRLDAGRPDAGPPRYEPPARGCDEVRTGVAPPSNVPAVDLLFVVDDSGSMEEEQDLLADGFPLFAAAVASGDLDGDGELDFPPVEDLHVGVVSTDMGWVGDRDGWAVPIACGHGVDRIGGHDGLLRSANRAIPGCATQADGFVVRHSPGAPIDAFAERFGCFARLGADGCGVEQPLEAALKALTPSTSEIAFLGGLPGHGDTLNTGFLRPGSILAVIVLTDEDDDSTADLSWRGVANEQYVLGDDWLYPVQRYVDGLQALRADPSRFVFAAIAGIPPERSGPIHHPSDADAILADPRMRRVYDPDRGDRLRPSCRSSHGSATPPRRLVELARALPGRAVLQSICEDDLRPAIRVIADHVGELVETTWCVDGEVSP